MWFRGTNKLTRHNGFRKKSHSAVNSFGSCLAECNVIVLLCSVCLHCAFLSTRLFINKWVAEVWNIEMATKQFSSQRAGVSGYNRVSVLYYTYQSPTRSNYTLLMRCCSLWKGSIIMKDGVFVVIQQTTQTFISCRIIFSSSKSCVRTVFSSFDICQVCLRHKSVK